jgi:CHASE2 domain-containing sensor protein
MIKTLRTRLAERWKIGMIGAALCLAITALVNPARWPSTQGQKLNSFELLGLWLDGLGHDILVRLSSGGPATGATVIAMDDRAYNQLGPVPWDRRRHGQIIERALAFGARAVVLDILFDRPTSAEADEQLVRAVGAHPGKVVLAAQLQKTRQGGTNHPIIYSELLKPFPALLAVARFGVVDLDADPDQRVRRHYVNRHYESLAWQAAEMVGAAPGDRLHPRWIKFYGSLNRISYVDLLQATNLPANYFAGDVVFVGKFPVSTPTGPDSTDVVNTAVSRGTGQGVPGVEVQATIFLNLVRKDWLKRLSPVFGSMTLLGCAVFCGFMIGLLRPWVAAWVAAAAAVLCFTIAAVAMNQFELSLPWLVIGAIQIPCALAWSAIAHTKGLAQETAELQRQLATATKAASRLPPVPRMPVIPDYTLLRCVGSGAYGDVWLARDLVGNFRAVKAIYRNRFPREDPIEREFHGIERFSPISRTHPGWVDILHIGRMGLEEGFYYIMEAGDDEVAGAQVDPETYAPRTLASDLRRRRKLPLAECVTLSVALADALEHLHRHALIHRDIKPSNVIFVQGQPKFADIGLVTDFSSTKHDVSFLGTEGYIAPEGPGSPPADVFSLGKLIYEVATGRDRRAFPEMPTSLEEGTPDPDMEELYRIVLKACEFEPRHRYPDATTLKADLERLNLRLR